MHFKKILFTFFTLIIAIGATGQTLLSSQHLDLKGSEYYHRILAAPAADYQQLAVFAADRDSIHILRYNSVLFCTDSLMAKKPESSYDDMVGYSFSGYKSGNVYWASNDLTKIQAVHYDFEHKTTKDYFWEFEFKDEDLLTYFSENDAFYIVTIPDDGNALRFYQFKNDKFERFTADFTDFNIQDAKGKTHIINKILEDYPLQKIEKYTFTPLADAAPKSKLYVFERQFMITLDINPKYTQVITINTDDFKVASRQFSQPKLQDEADTNSFYYGQKLYQFSLNKEQMALQASDIVSAKVLKTYTANRDEEVTFKNSPLLDQSANRPPDEFKNTKSFLRRANNGEVAVSVYQTPDDIMVTAGSIRTYMPAGEVLMGAGAVMMGEDPGVYDPEIETIYFESLFNFDFNHKDVEGGRLAVDYISEYIYHNGMEVSMQTVMPFTYYYILGYYDTRNNKYIIRKFEDDYYAY